MKFSFIISSLIILSFLGCSKERIVSKNGESQILKLLDEKNIKSFKMEPLSLPVLNAPETVIKDYVARMRMRYPKFSEDLLYAAIALDDENQYSITMRPEDRKCILFTNKIDIINGVKTCYEKFNLCMSGKEIDEIDKGDIKVCLKVKECKAVEHLDKGKVISKKYCEVIYGRNL